jgi:hypothetical protein
MPDSTAPQRTPESLTSSFHTVCVNCAGRALPAAQVERLRQTLSRLDEAGSLRDVVAAIAPSPDR